STGLSPALVITSAAGAFYYLLFVKLRNTAGKKADYAVSGDFACGVSVIIMASAFFYVSAPLCIVLLVFSNMFFNAVCDKIFSKEILSDLLFYVILNAIFVMTFFFFWQGNTAILSGFINSAMFVPQKIIAIYLLLILLIASYHFLKPEIMLFPQGETLFASSGLPYLASSVIMYFMQAVVFTMVLSCAGIFVLPALAVLCDGIFRNFKWFLAFPALLYAQVSIFILSKVQHPAVFITAFMLHFAVMFALKMKKKYAV
ncbi:MAG: hypothetical protein FWG92_00900, partial [Leptospirales bacterium]|nr:hypothetical protein [Leptospirales bacterium]